MLFKLNTLCLENKHVVISATVMLVACGLMTREPKAKAPTARVLLLLLSALASLH